MPSVLITGANRGLGLEFARQYAADGWEVVGCCRRPDEAAALRDIPGVELHALDAARPDHIDRFGADLAGRPLDLVIANAGMWGAETKDLDSLDPKVWLEILTVNAMHPILLARALLPCLRAGSGKMLVAVSSGLGSIAWNTSGGLYGYRTSKAALNAGLRSLAADLEPDGVKVAALSPGWVRTDMGGAEANLSPEESVGGMRRVIAGLDAGKSGGFFAHDGREVPW